MRQLARLCRPLLQHKCEHLKGFPQLEDETVDHFIAGADADGDGSISFEELFAVIQSVRIEGGYRRL